MRGRRQHSNCEIVIPISVSFSLPLKRNSKILKDNHLQEGFPLGASPYEIKARAKTLYEHLTTQNPDDTSIDLRIQSINMDEPITGSTATKKCI